MSKQGDLKELVARGLRRGTSAAAGTRVGRIVAGQAVTEAMGEVARVQHGGFELRFVATNWINRFRAESFASKEPETLEWIDGIPRDSVLWDVGANVGLYACYAAVARGCRVVAFEPSIFNLESLARNVFLNGVVDRVTIFPLPLSAANGSDTLHYSTTEWGGALSSFAKEYGHDGEALDVVFDHRTFGMTMDSVHALLGFEQPDFIKLDVDGIEHLILAGASNVLQSVQSVLVEVDEDFVRQAEDVQAALTQAGLHLVEKRHSEMIGSVPEFAKTFNQIWVRA